MKMIELDGNSVIKAVVRKLKETFPQVNIYKERANQGLTKPYFFVTEESFEESKLMTSNYLQMYIISVLYQYKDPPETSNEQFSFIKQKISDCLEIIELKDVNKEIAQTQKVRGTDKNSYVENEELQFFVNYAVRVNKPRTSTVEKAKTISIDVTLKE